LKLCVGLKLYESQKVLYTYFKLVHSASLKNLNFLKHILSPFFSIRFLPDLVAIITSQNLKQIEQGNQKVLKCKLHILNVVDRV